MANGVASGQKQIKGEKRKKEDSKYKYMRNSLFMVPKWQCQLSEVFPAHPTKIFVFTAWPGPVTSKGIKEE